MAIKGLGPLKISLLKAQGHLVLPFSRALVPDNVFCDGAGGSFKKRPPFLKAPRGPSKRFFFRMPPGAPFFEGPRGTF